MKKEFITIHEASELSGKSVQTIRRALKSKKLKHRKIKTPQGFNYLISRVSLCSIYNIKIETESAEDKSEKVVNAAKAKSSKVFEEIANATKVDDDIRISGADFRNFASTLERMVSQHSEERQNFLRLVNTLQEKIFVLENQVNLLQAPQKKWYQLWR